MNADLLLRIWSLRHPALREPGPGEAARAHVLGSLGRLAPHYRAGFALALRLVPPALLLLTGRRPAAAPPAALLAGLRRVERLPLLGTAVRTAETLALYSGLDAAAAGAPAVRGPAALDALGLDATGHHPTPLTADRRVSR
ncbi:hypothetical protein [Kitasatospora sp. NPDC057500]|uniref:hypothetical protein n=1 Tax=Kitasatospora sp. NPDC057500 TaxID=3346151 RepID=UPI00368F0B3C